MRRLRRIDLGTGYEPVIERTTTQPPVHDCGCGELSAGGFPIRCGAHRELLRIVRERFQTGMGWERKAIWQEQDGLGKRGYIPVGGGYDLSGLNNSTPAAIERMYRVAHGLAPLNGVHNAQEGS